MTIRSYKDLKVWKKSFDLSILVYKVTKTFPKEEIYGLLQEVMKMLNVLMMKLKKSSA